MADVECPYCNYHFHAGQHSRHTIWTGLVVGGFIAAASAYSTYHFLGWSKTSSAGLILIVAIVVAAILTGYSWMRNDFYVDS